jgi:hypothetical protein
MVLIMTLAVEFAFGGSGKPAGIKLGARRFESAVR